jgi:hypothetical protein
VVELLELLLPVLALLLLLLTNAAITIAAATATITMNTRDGCRKIRCISHSPWSMSPWPKPAVTDSLYDALRSEYPRRQANQLVGCFIDVSFTLLCKPRFLS